MMGSRPGAFAVIFGLAAFGAQPALTAAPGRGPVEGIADRYYWINSEEIDHFECLLEPDWRALLASQGVSGDSLEKGVAKLSEIEFHINFGPRSGATITRNEVAAENDRVAEGLNQVYSGVEQMSSGFFQTFGSLAYNRTPFDFLGGPFGWNAADQTATFTEAGGATNVKLGFAGDRIRQLDVSTNSFNSTVVPQFVKTDGKYRLAGYDATYAGTDGSDRTVLSVVIGYQPIEGFEIPASLDLSGSYNSQPFGVKIAFKGCSAVH